MKLTIKLTAIDEQGNAACAGMDETVRVEGPTEQAILDEARNSWLDYWGDDGRVRGGLLTVAAEVVSDDVVVEAFEDEDSNNAKG